MNKPESSPSRVLIVEDEVVVAADLEESLGKLGYQVLSTVETGRAAIQIASEERPDLVLMDIQLRGSLDGISAASEIVQRWQIPVIFLTATTNEETLSRANSVGAYGFLIKPFRIKELSATVTMAINQHRDRLQQQRASGEERGRLEERLQLTNEALGETQAELRTLLAHLLLGQDAEKRQLAMAMHNDLAQQTSMLGVQVESLRRFLPPLEEAQLTMQAVQTQLASLSQAILTTSEAVYPSTLNDLGLAPALRKLIAEFRSSGLYADLTIKGSLPAIAVERAIAFYRIAEEALKNASKLGRNAQIRIVLKKSGSEELQMIIEDRVLSPTLHLLEAVKC